MQQFLAPPKPRYALMPLTRLPTAGDERVTSTIAYKRKHDDDEGEMDEEDEVDDEEENAGAKERGWDSSSPALREKKRLHARKFKRSQAHGRALTITDAVHDQRMAALRKEAGARSKESREGEPSAQPAKAPRTFVLVPPGPPENAAAINFGRFGSSSGSAVNSFAPGRVSVLSIPNNTTNVSTVSIPSSGIKGNDSTTGPTSTVAITRASGANDGSNSMGSGRPMYPEGWRQLPPLVIHGLQIQLPRAYNVPRERIYYELYPRVYELFECRGAADRNFMLHEIMDRLSGPDLVVLPNNSNNISTNNANNNSSGTGRPPQHPWIMISANGMSRLCSAVARFAETPSITVGVSIISSIEAQENITTLIKQGMSSCLGVPAASSPWERPMPSQVPPSIPPSMPPSILQSTKPPMQQQQPPPQPPSMQSSIMSSVLQAIPNSSPSSSSSSSSAIDSVRTTLSQASPSLSRPSLQVPPALPPAPTQPNGGGGRVGSSEMTILSECCTLCNNLQMRLNDLALPGNGCSFPPAKLLASECSSQVTQIAGLMSKLSANIKILQNFEEYGNLSSGNKPQLSQPQPPSQCPLPPISIQESVAFPSKLHRTPPPSGAQKQKKKRGRPPLNPNVVGGISLSQINTNK